MKLSKYQQTIEEAYRNTNCNLVINACPGSGKTTTLVRLAKQTPIASKSIFLAFNKSIQEELSKKLPFNIKAKTLHSLGMSTLLKYLGISLVVNEAKTFLLVRKQKDLISYPDSAKKDFKRQTQYLNELCKLVDLYRSNLLQKADDLMEIALDYDIEVNKRDCFNVERVMEFLDSYNRNLSSSSMIDFVDMLYLCHTLPNEAFEKYKVVFIDEVQDLTPLQKSLVDKIIDPDGGRFIAVGDKKQLIYAFMGSNLNSFSAFEQVPNTQCLPLSVTYRCSKEVTKLANSIFEGVECFEGNIEGECRKGNREEIQEGDFVVCRNNFPLFQLYMDLLAQGKKAVIYGKDYGESLIKLLADMQDLSISEAMVKFSDKRQEMIQSLREKGITSPDDHPKIVKYDEMVSIIAFLFEEFNSVKKTIEQINTMFSNKVEGVTLLTIHKSKGLEAKRVFFLQPELLPSKYAKSQQMLYCEKCLYYVAVTRAKESLIFLD